MRHRLKGRKFCRTSSQRRALLSGLAESAIRYEQIKTTLPKAKDLRPYLEHLITIGKKGTLSARRQLLAVFHDPEVVSKIMGSLSGRYANRPGGYTRIIKAGYRYGDTAPMAIFEFVDRDPSAKPKGPSLKNNSEKTDMTPEEKAMAMASGALS